MKPMLFMRSTRSASSASSSVLRGSWVVRNEYALKKRLACCWAVKSCSRLEGPGLLSFTSPPPLVPSRSPLPRQQQRRSYHTRDDAEEVENLDAHQAVQRIRAGKRSEWTDIGVHDSVEH